jgi:hypothetical protein
MSLTEHTEAFKRGYASSQDWRTPHLNPYPQFTEDWFAWQRGFDEGNKSLLEPH